MDFIIISTADWDNPFWTNKQHTAKSLADLGHRVIYVDSLGLRRPTVTATDSKRIYNKFKRMVNGVRQVEKNIWVIAPFSIPFQDNKLIRIFNEKILIYKIKKIMRSLNFENPILWTYNPLTSFLIGKFNEKKVVYHCVDEISAQPGMPKELIKKEEINLLKKSDVVFVTSKTLYNNKKLYNENTFYFSNVADFEHFNKAYTKKFNKPIDLLNNKKKNIGFIGAISSYKVDFELLNYIAKKGIEYNFYLIGKVGEGEPETSTDLLKSNENIIFLGPKDYKTLPQYLAYFDVCILPCNKNEYTDSMFPMKFFEYIAAGKPVVSTNIVSILDFSDYCYIVDSKENFKEMIDFAIKNNTEEAIEKRLKLAKKYTYKERINKMLDKLKVIN